MKKVLVLSASPRRDGNSWTLAQAAVAGAREAGHEVEFAHLNDYVQGLFRDCRTCRDATGACSVGDRYDELLLEKVVPADGLVVATPLYWYGMSGALKTFYDRLFCHTSGSAPDGDAVVAGLTGKKVALLISCEESYRGATLGLTAQFQELARYLHQDLVGVAVGVGNSRGEVRSDPSLPLDQAADLGRRLFDIRVTDYRIDTERSNRVWAGRTS
ncbi:flavodoxin family protein [Kibdelosporangium phytohabitans]|uniref:NAD(P)H dehydrogenase n=1 Tax=Kibdelosporangium phytohabitans TaxID=860235 RepID=A0A0N9I6W5_9PSEU|nr:flavodoxin family protein [Kibdelosporangium phytohabitans]ALG11915.1 NAD(P)H dehydrogenase [Kibdelosporangium phytohabitans]MBE1463366.1 multimeric flavodoxin WrbA [Kibdelosporangium phytohabitans]